MRTIIVAISMTYAAVAAADPIDAAKQAVIHKLNDPESARFRNVRSVGNKGEAGEVICGEVNAKNRAGGYEGFVQFHYSVAASVAFIPGTHGLTNDPLDRIAASSKRFCGSPS